jgi:predicted acylesterase/phospholipase RssA
MQELNFTKTDKHIGNDPFDESNETQGVRCNIKPFNTIVLSGAVLGCIAMLGALQYVDEHDLIDDVSVYIGTSSGAICCFLLSLGYTPSQLITEICTKDMLTRVNLFTDLSATNLMSMVKCNGITSYCKIEDMIGMLVMEKIGKTDITLLELFDVFGKKLVCSTYNITKGETEYVSYENYPEMQCRDAIHMSANLPLIFENFKYNKQLYTDGGVSDNFPIQLGDMPDRTILGIYHHTIPFDSSVDDQTSLGIVKFIYRLLITPMNEFIKYKIMRASDRCTVIELKDMNETSFNFYMGKVEQLDLFSSGYQTAKQTLLL